MPPTQGSFGYGWSLNLRDVRIETDVPLTGSEASGVYNPLRLGSRLYIDTPTGERVGFTFAPQQTSGKGYSYWTPAWVADQANGWQLKSFDTKLQKGADRFYDLQTGAAYNPASLTDERAQYELIAPDGTVYEISAQRGITGIVFTDGVRLAVSDSGITGPGNESVRFVLNRQGDISQVVAPDGHTYTYGYDAHGNLNAVRDLPAAQSLRYGYADPADHLLTIATGASGGEAVAYGTTVTTNPVTADLGAALNYLANPISGSLASGATDRYSLSVRPSELNSPAGGAVLMGVIVEASPGSTLAPTIPVLEGYTAIASSTANGRAFALFRVDQTGLDLLKIAGSGSGAYTVRVFVAGDVNRDGAVDGIDAQLLDDARRTGVYNVGADANLDGVLDNADTQLLYANLGYMANQAPTLHSGSGFTHVDLETFVGTGVLFSDPEGDGMTYRVLSTSHGTATLAGDGSFIDFVPDAGFSGDAGFVVVADDGYSSSALLSIGVHVSDSPLLHLDFAKRNPDLALGARLQLSVIGDFADESGVVLPWKYLTSSISGTAATMSAAGLLTGISNGFGVVVVNRGAITAATAIVGGEPNRFENIQLAYGLDVYPETLTLVPNGATKPFHVHLPDNRDITAIQNGAQVLCRQRERFKRRQRWSHYVRSRRTDGRYDHLLGGRIRCARESRGAVVCYCGAGARRRHTTGFGRCSAGHFSEHVAVTGHRKHHTGRAV